MMLDIDKKLSQRWSLPLRELAKFLFSTFAGLVVLSGCADKLVKSNLPDRALWKTGACFDPAATAIFFGDVAAIQPESTIGLSKHSWIEPFLKDQVAELNCAKPVQIMPFEIPKESLTIHSKDSFSDEDLWTKIQAVLKLHGDKQYARPIFIFSVSEGLQEKSGIFRMAYWLVSTISFNLIPYANSYEMKVGIFIPDEIHPEHIETIDVKISSLTWLPYLFNSAAEWQLKNNSQGDMTTIMHEAVSRALNATARTN